MRKSDVAQNLQVRGGVNLLFRSRSNNSIAHKKILYIHNDLILKLSLKYAAI